MRPRLPGLPVLFLPGAPGLFHLGLLDREEFRTPGHRTRGGREGRVLLGDARLEEREVPLLARSFTSRRASVHFAWSAFAWMLASCACEPRRAIRRETSCSRVKTDASCRADTSTAWYGVVEKGRPLWTILRLSSIRARSVRSPSMEIGWLMRWRPDAVDPSSRAGLRRHGSHHRNFPVVAGVSAGPGSRGIGR
ncbi:MAG: hypothetical protein IPF66_19625 [Holophagales bacterium]|nr:hypothetical protein [Holophagales bacterium]